MTKKREQLEADQMVAKLESGESEEYSSLSSLVRDSFEYDFPESSSELEEAVLNELADVDSRIAVKPVPPVKPSSNRRKWALVATLLLSITALGAVFTTNEFMNSQSEVPMTASVAPESGIAAADISEAEQGRLGFHNYHDANKPLADSNSLWRRPQDRFSVPYTEETVQNYSVTVPDGGTVLLGGIRRSEEHLWYSQPNSFHRHRSINLPQRSTDSYAFFEELGEEYPGFDPNVRYFQILGEQKGGEQYHPIQENEFYRPLGEAAVSTFSIDVDTGAYSNMRRFVNAGRL
ncbi:MAG: von Willebrand factor type A domain-containing protein, partial [Planctomycetota bacterium]